MFLYEKHVSNVRGPDKDEESEAAGVIWVRKYCENIVECEAGKQ